jgi:hypothetical protein
MYLLIIWRCMKDFDAGNIHYKGYWKGWALKVETFLGPEMATSAASAIWAQIVETCELQRDVIRYPLVHFAQGVREFTPKLLIVFNTAGKTYRLE